jgi:hypothetical protein
MRELFLVGVKLYGVVSLFSCLTVVLGLIQLAQMAPGSSEVAYQWLISAAVSGAIVYASISQAERLADVFGLEKGERFAGFTAKDGLRGGLILIAVNRLLTTVPALIGRLVPGDEPMTGQGSLALVLALVNVAAPAALIWGSKQVTAFIEEHSRP